MNHFEKVFQCFPAEVRHCFETLPESVRESLTEIRVYRGREVQVFAGGKRYCLSGKISGDEMQGLLNNLMKFSYYAYEEDIAKGFITIDGGHRVGICGKAVIEHGSVSLLRNISSLNIRYSREVIGCSDALMKYVRRHDGSLSNLLIVSPPACGKTTLLRDMARNLGQQGFKVGICDERSEIAGMSDGQTPYTFGVMTDVLDGCPKAEGMTMLVRAMSPQVIVTDEIGKKEDADAIRTCMASGVKVITTIHGNSEDDLKKTGVWEIIRDHIFDYLVFLSDKPTVGTVKEVRCG